MTTIDKWRSKALYYTMFEFRIKGKCYVSQNYRNRRLPSKKVADNNFLSTIVDTDDEWIRQRTGIKERHLSNGKEGTTYMVAHAAEAALENAGIGADELDMIIVATVSADTYVPSTSCSVQGAIGAIRATRF